MTLIVYRFIRRVITIVGVLMPGLAVRWAIAATHPTEIGFDGMVRFLRQFDLGQGDYTIERRQWLDAVTLDEIFSDTPKDA
jgi:hypothetical protein